MGGAHSRVEAYIASPTSPPYLGKQLTGWFNTHALLTGGGCEYNVFIHHRIIMP